MHRSEKVPVYTLLKSFSSVLYNKILLRVPTRHGKPRQMRVHLENLEISWNFEQINKYHGKIT